MFLPQTIRPKPEGSCLTPTLALKVPTSLNAFGTSIGTASVAWNSSS